MKAHTFFIKLFISFVCLIVIPVGVVYGISEQRIEMDAERMIGRNCIKNLQIADNGVKQMENSLFKDCIGLARNEAISQMAAYGSQDYLTNVTEMLDVSHALDIMGKTLQGDDSYYSIYLYIENFPYFFTTGENMVPSAEMSDTGWMTYYKRFKEQNVPVSFTDTHALGNGTESPAHPVYVTTYIYPLTHYITTLQGALVVNIRESSLNKLVNSGIRSTDGTILILNKNGNVISAADSSLLGQNMSQKSYFSKILKSSKTAGYFSSKIGSTDYLVSYYRSDGNDWIYVGMAQTSVLMHNQSIIHRDTAILSLMIILLGILIAYLVSRRIYSPVKTMVNDIKSNIMASRSENDDEFSIIKKALDSISKKEWSQKGNAAQKLRENGIIKLIGDDLLDEEGKNVLSEFFPYDRFICAVISIDKYDETAENYGEKQWGYIRTLLMQLAEETIGTQYKCIGCTVKKGEITLVFNVSGKRCQGCQENLREGFRRFQAEVAKILDHSVTVGIGKCCADLTGIRETYLQAETAMRQKLRLGLGRIIIWEDEWNNSSYYYPFEMEEKIRNCLNLGQKEELTAKVGGLVENLKNRKKLSCENIIQIVTQLAGNTLVKYMIEHHINSSDVYGIHFDIYSEVAHMETLDEIRDMLIEKYSQLIDFSVKAGDQKKNVDSIVDYIRSHYKKDIGISDISEHIGLSYSHVRKIFKDEIGMSIVDYINSMRIREARELLKKRELSVKNIAVSLGYNNDQSFERYFKKIVGMTPGEFRSRTLSGRQDGPDGIS